MITRIEALNFRCLRDVQQSLGRFHVLVGANASGKTTFLDVVTFLAHLVSDGLDAAISQRTQNPADLTWCGNGDPFQLAVEAAIPEEIRSALATPAHNRIRYEVAIAVVPELAFLAEKVILFSNPSTSGQLTPQMTFPRDVVPRSTLLSPKSVSGARTIVNKIITGNDNFYSETRDNAWAVAYKLGPRKSALGNLPEDESKFPAATWLKRLLTDGVKQLVLNSLLIRKASPPGQTRGLKPDGSNLPWVISELERHAMLPGDPDEARLGEWIAHLRTALPDLEGVRTVERPDDKHRYLVLRYQGGIEIPSWMASDGTLRLLALTLPAYLPRFTGIYLIEEPENGIHPRAVETMFQSLSSVYDAQILLATHSPVILSLVDAGNVLCFAKTAKGATDIVLGSQHPALQSWKGETNLGVLFAAGVLG